MITSDGNDEYDRSMMAQDSELPSDEEELAAQLKLAYHDQQALDEKDQIKRLKERFIQVICVFCSVHCCLEYFSTRHNISLLNWNMRLILKIRHFLNHTTCHCQLSLESFK